MTSGYSTTENTIKSLSNGAIGYLPKPFTSDELVSIVFRALKYEKIHNRHRGTLNSDNKHKGLTLPFVPCPPKYYRLGYSSWMNIEFDGSVKVGVSDLYLKSIESINRINLLGKNEEVMQGCHCVSFESNDGLVHQYLSPLTGRIIDVNSNLSTNTTLIEKDPYFLGWIYTLLPSDLDYEIKHLTPCSSDRI
jgi:glycine cleavage system H protein